MCVCELCKAHTHFSGHLRLHKKFHFDYSIMNWTGCGWNPHGRTLYYCIHICLAGRREDSEYSLCYSSCRTFDTRKVYRLITNIFFLQCHHMSFVDFVVLPPGHGRSVTNFWGWDAPEAQLRCPDGVWVVIEEDVVPGGALNLDSTNLPRPWSPRVSSPYRKIPTVEPGIEPGTSWLVVRDWPLDHEAGRVWQSSLKESNNFQ